MSENEMTKRRRARRRSVKIRKVDGGKLRERRLELGLTQTEVAAALGNIITFQQVSNIEHNYSTGTPEIFIALCDLYNVVPSAVMTDIESPRELARRSQRAIERRTLRADRDYQAEWSTT